jgi:hypothetical protein
MTLIAEFENGDKRLMDIKPYLKLKRFEVFKELKNKVLFDKVKVVFNGFAIARNKRIDLDRYDTWKFGKQL